MLRDAAALALATVLLAPMGAAAGGRPAVTGARMYVSHSRIVSDVDCTDLFSEQIVGTVESGLPAVVELLYRIVDQKDDTVHRGVHTCRLRYDVWDDVYTLDRGDSSTTFKSFDAMRGAVEHPHALPIVGVRDVKPGGIYAIEFSVSVQPLRGGDEQTIVGWVDDTVRGQSDGSWHEQMLNVNDLIHRFFSRDSDSTHRGAWFRSIFFTPASLPLARDAVGTEGGEGR